MVFVLPRAAGGAENIHIDYYIIFSIKCIVIFTIFLKIILFFLAFSLFSHRDRQDEKGSAELFGLC